MEGLEAEDKINNAEFCDGMQFLAMLIKDAQISDCWAMGETVGTNVLGTLDENELSRTFLSKDRTTT